MEGAERRTHTPLLIETIEFRPASKSVDRAKIAQLHVERKLSTTQIASLLGCSKALVITSLKRQGLLRPMVGAQTDPTNYRAPVVPFGYRLVDGKLSIQPRELKICRLIVELVDRRGMNRLAVSRYLVRKGIKNRQGRPIWHNYTVSRIYDRWRGKL